MCHAIDATTQVGFDEVAKAFGVERALMTRVAQLSAKVDENVGFRWHAVRWQRYLAAAEFELFWFRKGLTDGIR